MVKKSKDAKKTKKPRRPEARDFADEVRSLLDNPDREDDATENARRVAAGLLFLLNTAIGRVRSDPAPYFANAKAEGGIEAIAMLNAIMRGQSHPFWWFLEGIRGTVKPNYRQVDPSNAFSDALIVGCVRAIMEKEELSMREASLSVAGHPFMALERLEAEDVRNRVRAFAGRDPEDVFVQVSDQWKQHLIGTYTTESDAIDATASLLAGHKEPPSVQRAGYQRPTYAVIRDGDAVIAVEDETGRETRLKGG